MKAKAIRDSLLNEDSEDLNRRRKVIFLSTIGLLDFSIISLYQTGIIKNLPDLPFDIFDSNKVNGSKDAYAMGVPDGTISAVTYAANMALASAGGSESAARKPVFDIALGASVLGNAIGAGYFLFNMATKQKKICLYCVTGALINFASAIIIAPTVIKSTKKLFS